MPVHNEDIARVFDELADLLEIDLANPFRVRAYRNAARVIRGLPQELAEKVAAGKDLTELPGIGKDLSMKILEVLQTGHAKALDRLHRTLPASLEEVLELPGLGPKKVRELHATLKVDSVDDLRRALAAGKVGALPGFGPKTEQRLKEVLAAGTLHSGRVLLSAAYAYGEPLVRWLRQLRGVEQVVIAGSYRRGSETVGDLDILTTATDHRAVIEHFLGYDEVAEVREHGTTRATVILRSGLQVDLRVVGGESFGAALHYFTGSKAHNIAVRRLAQQHGLKINEYGVFKGERQVAGADEASVFAAVDLPYIAPELRESRGEIEAAQQGRLPALIERRDLKGDLHSHSNHTDGRADLRTMAEAAREHGLSYLAITDHSQHLTVVKGLDEKRLRAQWEEIDRLNGELDGITLLKGCEVDILEDGGLDLPDHVLAELDLVIGAVHSRFGLSGERQTERILRAMDSPYFTLLAHPSGRLLNERPPYEVDMERIVRHARERGCYLELDAQPQRLDLTDVHCQLAKSEGVLIAIDSDAHAPEQFDFLDYGVKQARRGWLEKSDVLNSRALGELRKLLRRTRLK